MARVLPRVELEPPYLDADHHVLSCQWKRSRDAAGRLVVPEYSQIRLNGVSSQRGGFLR